MRRSSGRRAGLGLALLGVVAAASRAAAATTPAAPAAPCAYMDPADADLLARAQALVLRPDGAAAMSAALADPSVLALLAKQEERRPTQLAQDWPQLCYYKAADAAVSAPVDVVMLGDSITEYWRGGDPALFRDGRVLDRGISGQTSSQVLLRFMQDVVSLDPRIVHLMIGTNDVAGNTGPISDADVLRNVAAMADLAQAHDVRMVLAAIPPMRAVPWRPGVVDPAGRVVRLNAALRRLATARGLVFADYHAALADPAGGLPPRFSNDGVHPTSRGYAAMRPVLDRALQAARAPAR